MARITFFKEIKFFLAKLNLCTRAGFTICKTSVINKHGTLQVNGELFFKKSMPSLQGFEQKLSKTHLPTATDNSPSQDRLTSTIKRHKQESVKFT